MLLASLVVSAAVVAQEPQTIGDLARASVDAPLTISIPDPGEVVRQAARGRDGDQPLPLGDASIHLDQEFLAALSEFGVVLDDPSTWERAGIDPHRPLRFSCADPGGWLGLPQTSWLTFGVSDSQRALRFIEALHGAPEALGGEPPVFATAKEAWCILGGDARVLSTSRDDLSAPERLRDLTASVAASPTLGSDALFRMVAARVEGAVRGAMWLDLADLFEADNDVRAILAVVTDDGLDVGIAPTEGARWFAELEPGGTARELLAQFEPPVVAISASVAEPLRAIEGLEQDGAVDDDLGAVLDRVFALAGDDIDERLADTSIGVLLYARHGKLDDPRVAICVHVHGVQEVLARVREHAESGELPFEVDGAWLRGRVDGKDVVLGAVGDYIAFGDAIEEIRKAASDEASSWAPVVGGRSLLAVEVDVVEFALHTGSRADDEEIAALEREGRAVVEVDRGPEGLVVRARLHGVDGSPFLSRAMRLVSILLDL